MLSVRCLGGRTERSSFVIWARHSDKGLFCTSTEALQQPPDDDMLCPQRGRQELFIAPGHATMPGGGLLSLCCQLLYVALPQNRSSRQMVNTAGRPDSRGVQKLPAIPAC